MLGSKRLPRIFQTLEKLKHGTMIFINICS